MKRAGGHALLLLQLGDAYRLGGRITDASVIAQHALDLARTHKERGHEAYAMYMLGEIAAREGPVSIAVAETSYRRGLALADELSMRLLVAHCHLGLGKLYRRTGERDQAREHITTATTMYREMGMTYWLGQAETFTRRKETG